MQNKVTVKMCQFYPRGQHFTVNLAEINYTMLLIKLSYECYTFGIDFCIFHIKVYFESYELDLQGRI